MKTDGDDCLEPSDVVVQAELSPATANLVRDSVLQRLENDGSVSIELDGPDPTPCALQLVISAHKLKESRAVSVKFGEIATRQLKKLGLTSSDGA